jgi:hypothetical protein
MLTFACFPAKILLTIQALKLLSHNENLMLDMSKRSVGSLGILLLLLGIILVPSGVVGIWLGQSGIIINNALIHFGATTTDEINAGLVILSIGIVALVIFVILFFVKRDALKVELSHFP